MPGGVRIDGDDLVIRIPLSEVHEYRTALASCPCGASKSSATQKRRDALSAAIARATAGIPVRKNEPAKD